MNIMFKSKLTRFGGESRLLVAYDVTRMHNLEQMRKDFVDNISHELRTPLTVLSGYIETLPTKKTSTHVGSGPLTKCRHRPNA